MADRLSGIILEILGEALKYDKSKNKDLKNIKENNSYNFRHSNKINIFNKTMDYYKKHVIGSVDYTEETKVITEIVGLDRKRGILGYTENGTGKLIEINKNIH
jgi:hypothetical protein